MQPVKIPICVLEGLTQRGEALEDFFRYKCSRMRHRQNQGAGAAGYVDRGQLNAQFQPWSIRSPDNRSVDDQVRRGLDVRGEIAVIPERCDFVPKSF